MRLTFKDYLALIGIVSAMLAVLALSVALLTNNAAVGGWSFAVIVVGTWLGCREVA